MIEYSKIKAEVENPELTKTESDVVSYLDEKISDAIKREFPSTNTVYVGEVLFTDRFRSQNIPEKRRSIIIQQLVKDAAKAGWLLERDDSDSQHVYYSIMPKNK